MSENERDETAEIARTDTNEWYVGCNGKGDEVTLYRSLKRPDPDSPTFWQESAVWWDSWAHNFAVSMLIFPALAGLCVLIVMLVSTAA